MKLVFFASGQGSNFKTIVTAINNKIIDCEVAGLISDRDCNANLIAKDFGINCQIIKPKNFSDYSLYEKYLLDVLNKIEPDYIILAGYMRLIPKSINEAYPLRIINIHPSLLPAFKGKNAIVEAWLSGVKVSGVTIHYINFDIDAGAIIAQEPVHVAKSLATFENNIHETEHKLYVATLKELINKPYNKLIVSSCLLGENCRYDGSNKNNQVVINFVNKFKGEILKICPEIKAGFSIPRAPIDYINGNFISKNLENQNHIFKAKLDVFYDSLSQKIKKDDKILCILKENSPSCGVHKIGYISEKLRGLNNVFIVSEKDLTC